MHLGRAHLHFPREPWEALVLQGCFEVLLLKMNDIS